MESPNTWGKLEKTIDQALKEAAHSRSKGMIGLSTVRQIADALRSEKIVREETPRLWSHAFGGVGDGGVWVLVVFEDSEIPPGGFTDTDPPVRIEDYTPQSGDLHVDFKYLKSWDHIPSDFEKEQVTPEIYL